MDRKSQILSFLESNQKDSFLLFALAKEYEKEYDLESARDTYIQIKNNEPKYVGLYYHLAQVYINLNDEPSALIIFKEGLSITKEIGDQHAFSELRNALTNLEMGL